MVAPAVEQGGRYRLLLVEDSMPIGTQLKRILERNKFIVTWAKNGEEGYREFMDGYYDCVLTDIECRFGMATNSSNGFVLMIQGYQ